MKNTDLQALVQAVEQLIQRNTELTVENKGLRAERAQLIEKNEVARHKVEAMITRLKALEQDS